MFEFRHALKVVAVIWYFAVYLVRFLGIGMHIIRARACNRGEMDTASTSREAKENEGVTILRPLKGVSDSDLYECLKSTFVQTYSPIQILMCVSDPNDPSIQVASRLIHEYPSINAEILIGPDIEYGINPKVNNLVKGYKKAAYDIIWALDSNVKVHPDTLKRAIPKLLEPKIQLVHHLPIALANDDAGWGGLLDETYLMTAHSTFYTGINCVSIAPCVTGKSNLYRRSDVDRSVDASPGCGLEKFSSYMAEDQMISEALWAKGGRTAMAPDAAVQPLGVHICLRDFLIRRIRWVRLRKYMVTSATLVEPFTDCLFHNLFLVIIMNWTPLEFTLLTALWCAFDWINYRVLLTYTQNPPRPFLKWFVSWIARESLAFPLWLWAMLGHKIWWRNRPYRIKRDLTAERLG